MEKFQCTNVEIEAYEQKKFNVYKPNSFCTFPISAGTKVNFDKINREHPGNMRKR